MFLLSDLIHLLLFVLLIDGNLYNLLGFILFKEVAKQAAGVSLIQLLSHFIPVFSFQTVGIINSVCIHSSC
jgi:hypothetical protein